MNPLNRRRFIAAALGVPAAAALGRSVEAAPSSHTLWMLDPDWGFPLTTATGSDTKSRCRAAACRHAASHRYFLSEADAVAGRLHPCCLAQPVPVTRCVDLNALMPFYRARLGGVDDRCPTLPADLRSALVTAGSCAAPLPEVLPGPLPDVPGPPANHPPAPATPVSAVVLPVAGNPAGAANPSLPVTGASAAVLAVSATVAIALGAAAVRSSADTENP